MHCRSWTPRHPQRRVSWQPHACVTCIALARPRLDQGCGETITWLSALRSSVASSRPSRSNSIPTKIDESMTLAASSLWTVVDSAPYRLVVKRSKHNLKCLSFYHDRCWVVQPLREVVAILLTRVRLIADFEIALLTPLQRFRAHHYHSPDTGA